MPKQHSKYAAYTFYLEILCIADTIMTPELQQADKQIKYVHTDIL